MNDYQNLRCRQQAFTWGFAPAVHRIWSRRPSLRRAVILLSMCSAWLVSPAMAASKTYVVTSLAASKDVPGSLTWAIYQANYQGSDINYINFSIPGVTSETEIVLTEPLYIARPTIINAASQSGSAAYAGAPLIRINCNGFASGFTIVAPGNGLPGGGGSTIQGFRIINYGSNAITILRGADSNTIADNQIGFAPLPVAGTFFRNVTVAPFCRGIGIASSSNIIRGNTISGVDNAITVGDNVDDPASISGTVFKNNSFERNFIGTDATGMINVGNTSDGIFFGAGCQQNLIGPGNVLSGMVSTGVEFLHHTVSDNKVFGNLIGLNAAGTGVIGNGELGVLIANGASNNWVGGPGGAYPGNVISGNGLGGIAIGTAEWPGPDGSNNNHVDGNLIGTDAAESKPLGIQISGVTVQAKSRGNVIRKNVIVGQQHHGVVFSDATNNAMYGNWIGVTSKGVTIGNGSFAAYLFDASRNIVQPPPSLAGPGTEQNVFGANGLGIFGLNGTSADNVIDLSAPPPPPPSSPTPPPPAAGKSRLLNISTRMRVDTGDNALIAGFIITGDSAKKVIIRGLGTSLGIDGALGDPTLELNTGNDSVVNDDWRAGDEQAIQASGIPPASNLESAIVATLQPGGYTAILRGKGDTTGIGLLEVYDLDSGAPALLANISTRGIVQSGENVMIAGFILGAGDSGSRIVVRALGPSLGDAGISNPLNDPTLQLVNADGTLVRDSDNWNADAAQAAELTTLGLAPRNGLESAIVTTLSPGAYTAVVADKGNGSGTGLVEVYNVQ